MRRKNKILTILAIALTLVLIVTVSIAVVLSLKLSDSEAATVSAVEHGEELDREIEDLGGEITALESEKSALEGQVAELEGQIKLLSDEQMQKDELYAALRRDIDALKLQIEDKQKEIDELNQDIDDLESYINIDINAQIKTINKLNEILASPPERVLTTKVEKEDGTEEEIIEKTPGIIAVYYEDIENGYTFSHKADWVTSSASMLKAPFALSIYEAYAERDAKIAAGEEDKSGLIPLDTVFTYTDDKYRSGSGKIKSDKERVEYTYAELIDYMLRYSDNVAYYELRETYGIDRFRDLAVRLKCSGMMNSLSNMCVADCGKIMKAIYKFTNEGTVYGPMMLEAMKEANHTVLIPSANWGIDVAHKYGWDTLAYHDMGIVYDEHPYVVAVMTNLDQGGEDVDKYIRSILAEIRTLHKNFYK